MRAKRCHCERSEAILRMFIVLPAIDRDRARALLGETIREFGLLAMVFVPLDAAFASPLTQGIAIVAAIVLGATCVFGGIMLETRR